MRTSVRFHRLTFCGEHLPDQGVQLAFLVASDGKLAFRLADWSAWSRTWQPTPDCRELLGWRRSDFGEMPDACLLCEGDEVKMAALTPAVWEHARGRAKEAAAARAAGARVAGVGGWEDYRGGLPPAPDDPRESNPASQRP
jgi:hypothetical protein